MAGDLKSAPARSAENGPTDGMAPGVSAANGKSIAHPPALLHSPALLVSAPVAARMCGISERTWRKRDAQGLVPLPVRVGSRRLWAVENLRRWVEAGCPDREHWETTRERGQR